ncbi:MAG: menaquinone biosynthesis decarboxylase [Flavobacteriales bacterium]|nr:menaquinone biosynthesis decarboxylase [Flavobacteriales bacterium]
MAFKNLADFVKELEDAGELIRIKEFVDPNLEITEVVDRISKTADRNKALLFENNGTDFPILINSLGSYKRICIALGVNDLDDIGKDLENIFKELVAPKESILDKIKLLPKLGRMASWMPKVTSKTGACQEVVMDKPDLSKLPVMKCWPEDGGAFLTFPIVHTVHPHTKIRNIGMYRMQVMENDLTAMHWHKHKDSAGHFNEYKKMGKRMPVAISLGGDPAYTYAATAPMPPNVDEYMLAGFLRKKKVELVKCKTQDLYVPADCDFVIEGYVEPDEELIWEGPFGDHTGYYSLADWYPQFHVTCITHKKNAIYPSTIVGIPPQEDAWIGKATERIFLTPIKLTMLPEVVDMELPIEGIFHNLTIVKIKKGFAGHAQKVMNAMWGAGQMMFNKMLVVVDGDTDIHDYVSVAKLLTQNVDPESDIYLSSGPMDVLDHSCSKFAFGGKMCIDATAKMTEELRSDYIEVNVPKAIDKTAIIEKFPEIADISNELVDLGVSLVAISLKKNRPNHIEELNAALFADEAFTTIKAVIYIDEMLELDCMQDVIWRFANNLDPKRDGFVIKAKDDKSISHIGFDGTRKTKKYDNFQRDWPNVVCSDPTTIKAVDAKWDKLGLGEPIESPSIKYGKQMYGTGAIADD